MVHVYKSGSYCKDIQCIRHIQLEKYQGGEYLKMKSEKCASCHAWLFLNWLGRHNWNITVSSKDESSKALAARLKGIDPSMVSDLSEEDILCL